MPCMHGMCINAFKCRANLLRLPGHLAWLKAEADHAACLVSEGGGLSQGLPPLSRHPPCQPRLHRRLCRAAPLQRPAVSGARVASAIHSLWLSMLLFVAVLQDDAAPAWYATIEPNGAPPGPLVALDPAFWELVAPDAAVSVLAQANYSFAHEAPVWLPETRQVGGRRQRSPAGEPRPPPSCLPRLSVLPPPLPLCSLPRYTSKRLFCPCSSLACSSSSSPTASQTAPAASPRSTSSS